VTAMVTVTMTATALSFRAQKADRRGPSWSSQRRRPIPQRAQAPPELRQSYVDGDGAEERAWSSARSATRREQRAANGASSNMQRARRRYGCQPDEGGRWAVVLL
jgi:hypothetical protein